VKLSAVRTNEGRLFQKVGAQHENRRAPNITHKNFPSVLLSAVNRARWGPLLANYLEIADGIVAELHS